MFIVPCIIRKNIASRRWLAPLPRGEKIFGRSRAVNISSPFVKELGTKTCGARIAGLTTFGSLGLAFSTPRRLGLFQTLQSREKFLAPSCVPVLLAGLTLDF